MLNASVSMCILGFDTLFSVFLELHYRSVDRHFFRYFNEIFTLFPDILQKYQKNIEKCRYFFDILKKYRSKYRYRSFFRYIVSISEILTDTTIDICQSLALLKEGARITWTMGHIGHRLTKVYHSAGLLTITEN